MILLVELRAAEDPEVDVTDVDASEVDEAEVPVLVEDAREEEEEELLDAPFSTVKPWEVASVPEESMIWISYPDLESLLASNITVSESRDA